LQKAAAAEDITRETQRTEVGIHKEQMTTHGPSRHFALPHGVRRYGNEADIDGRAGARERDEDDPTRTLGAPLPIDL
jgi:hypothetical protein